MHVCMYARMYACMHVCMYVLVGVVDRMEDLGLDGVEVLELEDGLPLGVHQGGSRQRVEV